MKKILLTLATLAAMAFSFPTLAGPYNHHVQYVHPMYVHPHYGPVIFAGAVIGTAAVIAASQAPVVYDPYAGYHQEIQTERVCSPDYYGQYQCNLITRAVWVPNY
jgi:hypothetical protein